MAFALWELWRNLILTLTLDYWLSSWGFFICIGNVSNKSNEVNLSRSF